MTIVNGRGLLNAAPIADMLDRKARLHGVSHGLAEAGYDLTLKQDVSFDPPNPLRFADLLDRHGPRGPELAEAFQGVVTVGGARHLGRFALASSVERFIMPPDLVAVIGHKSTHARRGINVWAGTTAEPGWEGHLTLEIAFHGNEPVHIPAGSGIAQVLFHRLEHAADYAGGKYHRQPDRPVDAIMERG